MLESIFLVIFDNDIDGNFYVNLGSYFLLSFMITQWEIYMQFFGGLL